MFRNLILLSTTRPFIVFRYFSSHCQCSKNVEAAESRFWGMMETRKGEMKWFWGERNGKSNFRSWWGSGEKFSVEV
jgi:hypothetical protein